MTHIMTVFARARSPIGGGYSPFCGEISPKRQI